jgi:hypothetical protein
MGRAWSTRERRFLTARSSCRQLGEVPATGAATGVRTRSTLWVRARRQRADLRIERAGQLDCSPFERKFSFDARDPPDRNARTQSSSSARPQGLVGIVAAATVMVASRTACDSDFVRRVAPAFVLIAATALVATALGMTASPSEKRGGIHGRVTSAPTCPFTRTPPESGCEPRGFAAKVRIERVSDQRTVTQLVTASDGRFTVRLAPGRYGVAAEPASGGLHPECGSATRTVVRAHKYTRLTIECDSGIR